jgi:putative ABC transport system ATP-binding protein
MNAKKSIIRLENIVKNYYLDDITVEILKKINLVIYEGDFIAITGRSRSGKSTLMNLLGLLDTPTSGNYILDGNNVANLSEDELAKIRNKEIGFVFQSFNLLPRSTILENVILPAIYAGTPANLRDNKAKDLLNKVGLIDQISKRPSKLSGGQQQRVAIARALMNNPKIILADEPTGNLDTKAGDDVMNILKELNKQGKTIILITHEADIAKQAKKIIKIGDGNII